MPGKCVIVQCVAILLVSACAPSTRNAGLLPGKAQRPVRFGAEFYRNITGAVWYRDSNGDLRSIRNGWTGHQQARGDEITSEEKGGQQDLAHAQTTTPFPVSKSAPIESAPSDTRSTMATTDQQTATLDPQERCAMQAKRAFEELHANAQVGQAPLDKYRSHYYTKTGKCLMLFERNYVDAVAPGTEDFHDLASLIDANDRRQYAAYEKISHLNPPAPGRTEPLPRCELTPSLGEEKKCATREEFDAFVNGYLKE
jgi:hypothetical protein